MSNKYESSGDKFPSVLYKVNGAMFEKNVFFQSRKCYQRSFSHLFVSYTVR